MLPLPDHIKGLLITLAGVLVITPDGLLVRLVQTDEWTILFWRGVLSALAIGLGLVVLHGPGVAAHFRAIGGSGIWLALIFGVGSIAFVIGLTHTKVANALFITSSAPVWSALLSRVFLNETVAPRTWVAIGFALIGIAVIAASTVAHGSGSLVGDLAALAAALAMAGTFILARKARAISMVPAMVPAGLITAILVLPLASPFDLGAGDILWLALMGLVVVALGSALITLGPRYLPAPEVGLLLLLEAVLSPILVWAVIGESPGGGALTGGAIVLTTLIILNLANLRAKAATV